VKLHVLAVPALLGVLCAPARAVGQDASAPPAAASQTTPANGGPGFSRWQEFLDDSVKSGLWWVEVLGAGVIDQTGQQPPEWSGGSGYAKRNAADAAKLLSAEAIGHALAALMDQRVAYDPCTCRGASRLGHALGRAFVSLDSTDGHRVPNIPLWIAVLGSSAAATAVYPPSYTAHDVMIGTGIALGAAAGIKVLKEFTPELKRLVFLK
jgi:hypothetical protein